MYTEVSPQSTIHFSVLLLLLLKQIPQLNLRLFEDIKILQCYTQLSASPSTSTTTPLTLKTCWKYSNGQHFNSDDILLTDTSPCYSRSHSLMYQPCSHLFQSEHWTWCQKQYHLYNLTLAVFCFMMLYSVQQTHTCQSQQHQLHKHYPRPPSKHNAFCLQTGEAIH